MESNEIFDKWYEDGERWDFRTQHGNWEIRVELWLAYNGETLWDYTIRNGIFKLSDEMYGDVTRAKSMSGAKRKIAKQLITLKEALNGK